MRQRRAMIARLKAGFSNALSARALAIRFPIDLSVANDGMSPQYVGSATRYPDRSRIVITSVPGVMLYRGGISGASRTPN